MSIPSLIAEELEERGFLRPFWPKLIRVPIALLFSIFVHEMGHTAVALISGLKVVGIAFISFLGGYTAIEGNLAELSPVVVFVLLNAGVIINITLAWLLSEVGGVSVWRYISMTNSLTAFLNSIPVIMFYVGEPSALEAWQPIIGFLPANDGSMAISIFLEQGNIFFAAFQLVFSSVITIYGLYLFMKSEALG